MDLKQIEYIVKIAEENNITRAAEKLFITQSALNQQLLKLEKELGTPLFDRSRRSWHPTAAGELYLRTAREMLRMKHNLYHQIEDIANVQNGRLAIGFTPTRGIQMFSSIYPQFHRICPAVRVEPRELSVRQQELLLASEELDIGFMTLLPERQKAGLEYIPLTNEEIFLAVPRTHALAAHSAPPGEPPAVIDLALFKEEPFVLMYQTSTIRELVDELFRDAGFHPRVLFETSNAGTIVTMIQARMCCGLLPAYYVDHSCDDYCCFALPRHPHWEITAAYKKKRYLNKAAREMISLAASYWSTR